MLTGNDDLKTGHVMEKEVWNVIEDIEDSDAKKKRWRKIYIMYFTMFIQSLSNSITISSLWPFLKTIDNRVTEAFLGWINSSRSVAELIASILFGFWCDRRPSLEPLILSNILFFVGNLLYAFAEPFGKRGLWVIFGSRLFLGVSGGSAAVSRTVIAHLSRPDELSKTLSHLEMYDCTGYLIGPAIQSAVSALGSKGIYIVSEYFHFNMYTAPSYVLILLGVIHLGTVIFFMRDETKKIQTMKKNNSDEQTKMTSDYSVDKYALCVMLLMFFFATLALMVVGTLFSPIMMAMFGWKRETTVAYGGVIATGVSIVGVVTYLLVTPISRKVNDRTLMLCALLCYLIEYILFIPAGPGKLQLTKPNRIFLNRTIVHHTDGGCPYEYNWCHFTPQLPLAQFLVGAGFEAIASALAFSITSILYVKIIGPSNQGAYMGWLSSTGSFARILVPMFATNIYVHFGIYGIAGSNVFICATLIILFVVAWKRIVPYNERHGRYTALK